MINQIRPAIVITLFFTVLLGLAYPLAVTGISGLAFPFQAGGSIIRQGGKAVGSELLAQSFTKAQYLQPRPSAAGTNGYDATASSGSNLGPLNPDLIKRVGEGAAAVRTSTGQAVVPADAVTTSGSGLDPDITPEYAALQVARIAKARGVEAGLVTQVIAANTQGPTMGFLGQPRVNVLKVNLALDRRLPLREGPA
jgi:K+-transporting ATPase ATPase C chain